ncbi:trypsin-like serine protease [Bdellovibrio sp. KM01]|uniref:S1 family peptidase n=1 Tax=Bdellovibrio sp. KM01 TaxID=2748865 RepID=UPI0015E98D03|nr:trypsin-like serine protease [Bdellovibrio sp. KM01]QLY26954.1 trypsin-like serine protease [Bdellovibrio sp. KM01]
MKLAGILAFTIMISAVACTPAKDRELKATGDAIIGGTLVKKDSRIAKSTVGIYDVNIGAVCTGILLENNIVVTAAHCVQPDDVRETFIVFSPDMESLLTDYDKIRKSPLTRRASAGVINDKYKNVSELAEPNQPTHDIALLKFNGTIPKGYMPAQILNNATLLKEGSATLIAGYGVETDNLVEVDTKQTPPDELQALVNDGVVICDFDMELKETRCFTEEMDGPAVLKSTSVNIGSFPNAFEAILLHDKQHGPCSGDSGGPAFIKSGSDYFVWGLTSRSEMGCATSTVYTNIVSYRSWIKTESAALLKKKK